MDLKQKCLDIFYNNIIKEAQTGRIDSYFMYNIIFNTKINNNCYQAHSNIRDLLIPTLDIKNKNEFDELLYQYVKYALEFYEENNFPEEILNDNIYNNTSRICKEKTIIALLFSNATIDDFANPNLFLRKRIDFIKNTECNKIDLGYLDILNANIEIKIIKDIINNETPYQFVITATSGENEEYIFPCIKFGISNNKLYVYAIQSSLENKNTFSKKMNRILYKIGEGFDANSDNYEIYDSGNLKDVTPSFLVATNIFISYFNQLEVKEVILSSLLIERWNAKKIANNLRFESKQIDEPTLEKLDLTQQAIQNNLTEKFIRTFLRLSYHYNGIDITSYPFEIDANTHLYISDLANCNNTLLFETGNLTKQTRREK